MPRPLLSEDTFVRPRSPLYSLAIVGIVLLIGLGFFVFGRALLAWYYFKATEKAMNRGLYTSAETDLEQCLWYWNRNAEAHYRLARVARLRGDYDKAKDHLDKCEELGWSEEALWLEQTLLAAQQGQFAELEKVLIELANKDNLEAVPVMEVLAMQYGVNRQYHQAIKWGERCLAHMPENTTLLVELARVHESIYNTDKALKYYYKAVEVAPDEFAPRYALADTLVNKTKQYPKALEHLELLQEQRPQDREVLFRLALCRWGLGQGDQARELLDDLIGKAEDRLAKRHAETEKGLAHKERVAEAKRWLASLLTEKGKWALQERKFADAETCLRKAVDLNPNDGTSLNNLAVALKNRGKKKEGDRYESQFKKLKKDLDRLDQLIVSGLRQEPNNPAIHYEIGVLLLRYGAERQGVEYLLKVLKASPRHVGAHKALARYYAKLGEKELAAKHQAAAEGKVVPVIH
jgi:tetratricopeptide (TPR) repeat protein